MDFALEKDTIIIIKQSVPVQCSILYFGLVFTVT